MANFATAALVKAQAKLIGAFQSGELRYRTPEVHNLYLRNTSIMIPDYMELRTREDRVVETNYFLRTSRALGSGRSHNHTGAQGDSGILTPSWATYNDPFVSTLKEADNKIYSWEDQHMSKLQNAVINFIEGLDSVASAHLFANRSGVNVATAGGTFNAVDDVFQITEASNGDRAIQVSKSVMDVNKWQRQNFTFVCDTIAFNKFEYLAFQGSGNSANTSFQFNGVNFVHDPSLTAAAAGLLGAYANGFWIVVPEGTVAALPWLPMQNRAGLVTKENMYGTVLNPIDGLTYGVHSYEERVDGTLLGGYSQDVKTETEISIDMAYELAPLSTAGETPAQAFAFV